MDDNHIQETCCDSVKAVTNGRSGDIDLLMCHSTKTTDSIYNSKNFDDRVNHMYSGIPRNNSAIMLLLQILNFLKLECYLLLQLHKNAYTYLSRLLL